MFRRMCRRRPHPFSFTTHASVVGSALCVRSHPATLALPRPPRCTKWIEKALERSTSGGAFFLDEPRKNELFKEKQAAHTPTRTRLGRPTGFRMMMLSKSRRVGRLGMEKCVWWSCVLENLRRRQSFSKSRTAEIFVVRVTPEKILKMKTF